MFERSRPWRLLGPVALGVALAGPVAAAPLLIDDFNTPGGARTSVLTTVGDTTLIDNGADILGGVRDTYHHLYSNPDGASSTLNIGAGVLSVQQGTGVLTEVLLGYGAFTRPGGNPLLQGPNLNLDITGYDAFEIDFDDGGEVQNLNVVLYSANPLDPGNPLYYSTVGVNAAPGVPGGPMRVVMPFAADPNFNFADVDGIVLVINRANSTRGNHFVLDRFSLVNTVPEPGSAVLAVLALAALAGLSSKRNGRGAGR